MSLSHQRSTGFRLPDSICQMPDARTLVLVLAVAVVVAFTFGCLSFSRILPKEQPSCCRLPILSTKFLVPAKLASA